MNAFAVEVFHKFLTLLKNDTIYYKRVSNRFRINFAVSILFACSIWTAYCVILCGDDEASCMRHWIVGAPFKILEPGQMSRVFAEFFWQIIGTTLTYNAFVCGPIQVLARGKRMIDYPETPNTSFVKRVWHQLCYLMDLVCRCSLQPLVILLFVRGFPIPDARRPAMAAVVATCMALALHLLKIFCQAFTRVSRRRGLTQINLNILFVLVLDIR